MTLAEKMAAYAENAVKFQKNSLFLKKLRNFQIFLPALE